MAEKKYDTTALVVTALVCVAVGVGGTFAVQMLLEEPKTTTAKTAAPGIAKT